MVDLARALEPAFRLFGRDAIYTPQGGAGSAVRVIVVPHDPAPLGDFTPRRASPSFALELRKSDVPGPRAGDAVALDGKSYRVASFREDSERLVWRLELNPV